MSKMNKRIKQLWVAALRSGEYAKGKGALRANGKFCCLGVLCNLHAQEHPKFASKQTQKNLYGGKSELPPIAVYEWAKLDDYIRVNIDGNLSKLEVHNDNGVSFKKIAKAIEEQL